jgi:WD40 repeat protein
MAAALALLACAGLCIRAALTTERAAPQKTARVPAVADKPAPFDRFDPAALPTDFRWGLETAAVLRHAGTVNGVTISSDGEWIATAVDQTVTLWRAGGTKAGSIDGLPGPVRAVAFHPDGKSLAVGGIYPAEFGPAGWFQVWRLEKRQLTAGKAVTETLGVYALAFISGTDLLAVAGVPIQITKGEDSTETRHHRVHLRRVRPDSCQHVANLSEGTTPVTALTVSHDGRTMAFLDVNGELQIWNVGAEPTPTRVCWATAALLAVAALALTWPALVGYPARVWRPRLAFGLVVIGLVCCVALWAAPLAGTCRYRLATVSLSKTANALTCSCDGQLVAVIDSGKARVWRRDGASLRELDRLDGHGASLVNLAFSPAGPWLASLNNGNVLRFTHLPSNDCVRRTELPRLPRPRASACRRRGDTPSLAAAPT